MHCSTYSFPLPFITFLKRLFVKVKQIKVSLRSIISALKYAIIRHGQKWLNFWNSVYDSSFVFMIASSKSAFDEPFLSSLLLNQYGFKYGKEFINKHFNQAISETRSHQYFKLLQPVLDENWSCCYFANNDIKWSKLRLFR